MLSWIRNLLGIRKDVIDTNKAKIETLKAELEVDKLEDEASQRNLITRATMDDVKKYDPRFLELLDEVQKQNTGRKRGGGFGGGSFKPYIRATFLYHLKYKKVRLFFFIAAYLFIIAVIILLFRYLFSLVGW
jgi:hypothetical protein